MSTPRSSASTGSTGSTAASTALNRSPVFWPIRMLGFVVWFSWQILTSSVDVLGDILTPRDRSDPRIVAWQSQCASDVEISLMAIAISLTPGTLVVSMDEGPTPRLFVHAMYGAPDEVRASLDAMQASLLGAVRMRGVG